MKTFATLKEVIMLLQQLNINPFKNNTRPPDKKSKLWVLYDGIANNKFHSEEEAMAMLYQGKVENATYRKLKSDLQEKLLEMILTVNFVQAHYSDYQKAYYDTHKQWATIRFLIGQNANTAGLILAQRLFRQAEKFDFTFICMDIASYFRVQYGLRDSNDKRFNEANCQFHHYHKIYIAECLAEELYTSLIAQTVNNRAAHEDVNTLANEYYSKIEPLMRQYQTYKLQMYGYMVGLIQYTSENDYKSALNLCNEAIDFFQSRPYEPRVPLQIFYYQHLLSNIQLNQLEEANQSVLQCLKLMDEGTFNWFKFNELYLILLIHLKKFKEAEGLLATAMDQPRFEFLPDNAKEIWLIFESYINYLILLGKIETSPNSNFRMGRFINQVPIFSKDKGGMNIAIIIIKFLYLLLENKYSRVIDEVEPIEQYCYRHLRNKNTRRSYLFLKLLVQIPSHQFEKDKFSPKVKDYLEQLRATPLQLANQTYEIEIIPYEHLWSLAIESLTITPKSPK